MQLVHRPELHALGDLCQVGGNGVATEAGQVMKWKYKGLLAAMACLAFLPGGCSRSTEAATGSTIEAKETAPDVAKSEGKVWDFGQVVQGDVLSHDFEMKVDGNFTDGIGALETSCGCTTGEILVGSRSGGAFYPYTTGDPLPQGAFIKVSVAVDTSNRNGVYSGSVSVIGSGDRVLRGFRIAGSIRPVVTFDPAIADLGIMTVGAEPAAKTFAVDSAVLDRFALAYVKYDGDQDLTVVVHPMGALRGGKAESWLVEIGLAAQSDPNPKFFGRAVFSVTGNRLGEDNGVLRPEEHRVVLPVKAEVVARTHVEPAFASFGVVGQGSSKRVILRYVTDNAAIDITRHLVISIGPGYTEEDALVQLSGEVGAGSEEETALVTIEVRCAAECPLGPFRTDVTIQGLGISKTVQVPVFGIVGPAGE